MVDKDEGSSFKALIFLRCTFYCTLNTHCKAENSTEPSIHHHIIVLKLFQLVPFTFKCFIS